MKILFLDMSTRLETIYDLEQRARGGMVASLFHVTNGLARMGYEVQVLSDIKQPGITHAGVRWDDPKEHERPVADVLVCNRGAGSGFADITAKHRVLWTHDLPHNGFLPEPKTIRAFSRVVCMSNYAKRIWKAFYKTIGKVAIIPNGVDKYLFRPLSKDPGYLIFTSAPNRGLKRLPLIFEAIRSRTSPFTYMRAFSNMSKLHPNEVKAEDENYYDLHYKDCAEAGIDLVDPVPQPELAKELGKAALMILPTDYPEICSNSVLQALACGVPVVTTGNLGSACEWIKHGWNGMLTEWHPHDYMIYQLEMVRNAVGIMTNGRQHVKMMRNAARSYVLSWDDVVQRWDGMIRSL